MANNINNIDNMLSKGFRYVYADATHLHPKGRAQLLNNLKTKPDSICAVYMDVPLNIILARNAQREGRARVPEDVVRRMYNSVSLPTINENINTLFFVNEDGEIDIDKTRILRKPEMKKKVEREMAVNMLIEKISKDVKASGINAKITGRDEFEKGMSAIIECQKKGIRTKINTVLMKLMLKF